jgi:hypothetical protein
MATKAQNQAEPTYEAGKTYRVKLARAVKWRGITFRPSERHIMDGALVEAIKEAVSEAIDERAAN